MPAATQIRLTALTLAAVLGVPFVSVKYMTGRYNVETGKSDAEIPTPRGQDLASTFKKVHLPLSRCPISSRGEEYLQKSKQKIQQVRE